LTNRKQAIDTNIDACLCLEKVIFWQSRRRKKKKELSVGAGDDKTTVAAGIDSLGSLARKQTT